MRRLWLPGGWIARSVRRQPRLRLTIPRRILPKPPLGRQDGNSRSVLRGIPGFPMGFCPARRQRLRYDRRRIHLRIAGFGRRHRIRRLRHATARRQIWPSHAFGRHLPLGSRLRDHHQQLHLQCPAPVENPMIRFSCPGCGRKFNVPDNYAGKKAKCKTCGQRYRRSRTNPGFLNPRTAAGQIAGRADRKAARANAPADCRSPADARSFRRGLADPPHGNHR